MTRFPPVFLSVEIENLGIKFPEFYRGHGFEARRAKNQSPVELATNEITEAKEMNKSSFNLSLN